MSSNFTLCKLDTLDSLYNKLIVLQNEFLDKCTNLIDDSVRDKQLNKQLRILLINWIDKCNKLIRYKFIKITFKYVHGKCLQYGLDIENIVSDTLIIETKLQSELDAESNSLSQFFIVNNLCKETYIRIITLLHDVYELKYLTLQVQSSLES